MVVKGIRINILNASFFYEVRSITKFDVYIFMYLSFTDLLTCWQDEV